MTLNLHPASSSVCQRSAALQLHKGEPTTPSKLQLGAAFPLPLVMCHTIPWGNTRLFCTTLRALSSVDLIPVCCSVPSIPFWASLHKVPNVATGEGDCTCRCPVLWRHENTGKSPLPFRCQDVNRKQMPPRKSQKNHNATDLWSHVSIFWTANE